jgi:hypothetical protein
MWPITENNLRRENGYNMRAGYNTYTNDEISIVSNHYIKHKFSWKFFRPNKLIFGSVCGQVIKTLQGQNNRVVLATT